MSESYRLTALIELREREQEEASIDLLRAKEAAANAKKDTDDARVRSEEFAAETERVIKSTTAGSAFRADHAASASQYRKARAITLQALQHNVVEFEDRQRDAEIEVERCEQRVRDSHRELESVRKHRASWQDERNLAARRAEDNVMDELHRPGSSKS